MSEGHQDYHPNLDGPAEPVGLAMGGWEFKSPTERNEFIGDLIGGPKLSQLYLAMEGQYLWVLTKTEPELAEMRRLVEHWQESDDEWRVWCAAVRELKPAWRGKLTVKVERWHLRYFETPGGGWNVIEAIRAAGNSVEVLSTDDGWRVVCDDNNPHHGHKIATGKTMQEAACLAAIKVFSK